MVTRPAPLDPPHLALLSDEQAIEAPTRLADLRITPVRRRRKGDIFCRSCGQFHERELHPVLPPLFGAAP